MGWAPRQGTELTVLYNLYGPRIAEVGFDQLPDTYEQAFHRVDLTLAQQLGARMRLKLSAANLLNSQVVLQQGDIAVLRYRPGVSVGASIEWSPP